MTQLQDQNFADLAFTELNTPIVLSTFDAFSFQISYKIVAHIMSQGD